MPKKRGPLPHILLKCEEAVDEFLKVKPPKKGKFKPRRKQQKQTRKQRPNR